MTRGDDERYNKNRLVTRTRLFGYVTAPDDPQLYPINVGSSPATPQKGYFPVIQSPKEGETNYYTNDIRKTRWGATRRAKKIVRDGDNWWNTTT